VRFQNVHPTVATAGARSDYRMTFQRRRFRQARHDCRLSHKFVTASMPERNGLIGRFFRRLNQACALFRSFAPCADAKAAIRRWIEWYNHGRPHQALAYRRPPEHRAQLPVAAA